jgi:hypothetical protein
MPNTKRDFGQIVCGAVMLLLGLSFLWFERCALLGGVPIFVSVSSSHGWTMYPWQAITVGGLSFSFGLLLVVDAICLHGATFSRRKTLVAAVLVIASAISAPLIYWFYIRFSFFSLAASHVLDVPAKWLPWFTFFEWAARSIIFVWFACFILAIVELIRHKRITLLAGFLGAPLAAAAIYFIAWQVFIQLLENQLT